MYEELKDWGLFVAVFLFLSVWSGAIAINVDRGTIHQCQTRSGEITVPSPTDTFNFYGIEGERFIITMTVLSGELEPKIQLYDPDGIEETSEETIFQSVQINNHQLAKTGTYTVVCSDRNNTQTGTYNLSLSKIPSADLGLVHPSPFDGENVVPINTNLSWDAVPNATGYDVYFGKAYHMVLEAENIPGTSYDPPGNLETDMTYHWYIVAHRPGGDMRGPTYIFRTAKGIQPPTQPQGELTLAYVITVPSTDPDGNPVTYKARWQSDTGDDITHNGLQAMRGKLVDVMEETDRIQPGQTWTVTVTPYDGVEDGPSSVESIRWPNLGGYLDTNNDGKIDVSDVVYLVKWINGAIE